MNLPTRPLPGEQTPDIEKPATQQLPKPTMPKWRKAMFIGLPGLAIILLVGAGLFVHYHHKKPVPLAAHNNSSATSINSVADIRKASQNLKDDQNTPDTDTQNDIEQLQKIQPGN